MTIEVLRFFYTFLLTHGVTDVTVKVLIVLTDSANFGKILY